MHPWRRQLFFSAPHLTSDTIGWTTLFVTLEEAIKLAGLLILFSTSSFFEQTRAARWSAVFFGLGFGLFEIVLIAAQGVTLYFSVWLMVLVHIATTYLLVLGVRKFFQPFSKWITFLFFLLAIFIHLCYNLVVISFNA